MSQRSRKRQGSYKLKAPFWGYNDEIVDWPAWGEQTLSCRKLIEFVDRKGAPSVYKNNGDIVVSYDELMRYGIPNGSIVPAINLAVALGLLEITSPPLRVSRSKYSVTKFRLTFRPTWDFKNNVHVEPTWEHRAWMPSQKPEKTPSVENVVRIRRAVL